MPKKLVNALTPLAVKNAKPGRHADGGGLQLLVKESGARSWVFRFMLKGKSRYIGLGPAAGAGAIPLAKARDLADALRVKVKGGIDPLAERERDAAEALAAAQAAMVAGVTFKAMAETHIAANKESWRNAKHRQQWENTLKTYAYPVFGDLPVAEVDTPHVGADTWRKSFPLAPSCHAATIRRSPMRRCPLSSLTCANGRPMPLSLWNSRS